jgi:TPR repeat protein
MIGVEEIVIQTLENELETDQVDTFINHLKSILVLIDKNKSSISLSQYLQLKSKEYPDSLKKYASKLEELSTGDDPMLIDLFGSCIASGIGTEKDPMRSFSIFAKAAYHNYHRSIFNLGLCYSIGQRVDFNQIKGN